VLAGNVGDFLINEPRYFAEGDFWLVRRPDGSFLAFHARDTRPWLIKGSSVYCRIEWRTGAGYENRISGADEMSGFSVESRCSASRFTLDGTRTFGPSPRNLDRYPVSISGAGRVVVDVAKNRLSLGKEAN